MDKKGSQGAGCKERLISLRPSLPVNKFLKGRSPVMALAGPNSTDRCIGAQCRCRWGGVARAACAPWAGERCGPCAVAVRARASACARPEVPCSFETIRSRFEFRFCHIRYLSHVCQNLFTHTSRHRA